MLTHYFFFLFDRQTISRITTSLVNNNIFENYELTCKELVDVINNSQEDEFKSSKKNNS